MARSSTAATTATTNLRVVELESCDYLVVGAGAMGLAFCDTLLTELHQTQGEPQQSCRVVLVDRHPAPGGHWNDDYDFVRLHQPSLVYGVNSRQLEGNWMKCALKGSLPWSHQATKPEILAYYRAVVDDWIAQGKVRYFPNSNYDFAQASYGATTTREHTFTTADTTYRVRVEEKFVDAVRGECLIPSKCPPAFAVHPGITLRTPNQVFSAESDATSTTGWFGSLLGRQRQQQDAARKYVVIGCGKTGMDTVVYLQSQLRVPPEDIFWVVPRDVWMLNRSNSGPSAYTQALLRANGNHEQAVDDMERDAQLFRLDPEVRPTANFRFPTVSSSELALLRKVDQKIRRGRVSYITVANGSPCLHFENSSDTWMFDGSVDSYVFVHCTSPGPFNGAITDAIFPSKDKLILAAVFAPPIPLSGAAIAWVESARRRKALDLDFARRLLGGSEERAPDEDEALLLKRLLPGYNPGGDASHQLLPLRNLAVLLAIGDRDPRVAAQWFTKNNRLSIYNWLAKLQAVENLEDLIKKKDAIGLPDEECEFMSKLLEKLEPLRGL